MIGQFYDEFFFELFFGEQVFFGFFFLMNINNIGNVNN